MISVSAADEDQSWLGATKSCKVFLAWWLPTVPALLRQTRAGCQRERETASATLNTRVHTEDFLVNLGDPRFHFIGCLLLVAAVVLPLFPEVFLVHLISLRYCITYIYIYIYILCVVAGS